MKVEIYEKERIKKKFASHKKQLEEYIKHIGYGASGSYDDRTKIGTISSYREIAQSLEKQGYKNLNFCNGGDDDWLVVDHERKEFGFWEDNTPMEEAVLRAANLTELWRNS